MTHEDEPNAPDERAATSAAEGPQGSSEGDGPADEHEAPEAPRVTPLSVREVMGEATAGKAETVPAAAESEPETRERTIEDPEGRTWWARVGGATRSGWPTDAGAPLLLVVFTPDGPDGEPVREAFAVGSSLETLPDDELVELLTERARAYRSPESPAARSGGEQARPKRGRGP